jgi:hypothetical protein
MATLNKSLRRRLMVGAAIVLLAGAVVSAHSALNDHHIGDVAAACLAVMQVAAVGVGAAVASGMGILRRLWPLVVPPAHEPKVTSFLPVPRSRAGPELLQVFRL